jgi:hypothetical protein
MSNQGTAIDIGAWLRGLGLAQYEAAFRENAIAADILYDLTDQDLEKLGVLLGDRRRLLRAIAALDGASATSPAPTQSPVKLTLVSPAAPDGALASATSRAAVPSPVKPTPITPAAASPISTAVEATGEPPNVAKLSAARPALLQTDIAQERFTLEGAMRQVAAEATRKPRTETQTAKRSAPADTPGGAVQVASRLPRQHGTNPPPTDLPEADWHAELLLSARERLLRGRHSLKKQRAKEAEAPQTARPPRDSYELNEPQYPPVAEAAATSHMSEPQVDLEDLNSVNYDTRQETDPEPTSTLRAAPRPTSFNFRRPRCVGRTRF